MYVSRPATPDENDDVDLPLWGLGWAAPAMLYEFGAGALAWALWYVPSVGLNLR